MPTSLVMVVDEQTVNNKLAEYARSIIKSKLYDSKRRQLKNETTKKIWQDIDNALKYYELYQYDIQTIEVNEAEIIQEINRLIG